MRLQKACAKGETDNSRMKESKSKKKGKPSAAPRKGKPHKKKKNAGLSVRKRITRRLRRVSPQKLAVTLAAAAAVIGIVCAVRAVTKALGPEDYDVSTIEFCRNGSVRVTTVEDFAQDYYDASELKKMIREEIASYNETNGAGSVKQSEYSVTDGKAKAVLTYQSVSDYQSFNHTTMFVGTVQEAEDQGFDFESIMSAVSRADSSRILNQATLDQLDSNEVIILTEQANVVTAGGILYATPNLGVTDETHASAIDTISAESPAIIILK